MLFLTEHRLEYRVEPGVSALEDLAQHLRPALQLDDVEESLRVVRPADAEILHRLGVEALAPDAAVLP